MSDDEEFVEKMDKCEQEFIKYTLRKTDIIRKYIMQFTRNCITIEVPMHDIWRQMAYLDKLEYVRSYHVFFSKDACNDIILTKEQVKFMRFQGKQPDVCKGPGQWYLFVNIEKDVRM